MELKTLGMALSEADAIDFESQKAFKNYRTGVHPQNPAYRRFSNSQPGKGDYYPDDVADEEGRAYTYVFKDGVFYANPTSASIAHLYPLFYSEDYLKTWKVAKNDISKGAEDDTMPRKGRYTSGVMQSIRRDLEREIEDSLERASVYYDDDGDLVIKPADTTKPTFYMKVKPDNRFFVMADGKTKSEDDFWFSREFNKNGKPNADWHNIFMLLQLKIGHEYTEAVPVPGEYFKYKGQYIQRMKTVLKPKNWREEAEKEFGNG